MKRRSTLTNKTTSKRRKTSKKTIKTKQVNKRSKTLMSLKDRSMGPRMALKKSLKEKKKAMKKSTFTAVELEC